MDASSWLLCRCCPASACAYHGRKGSTPAQEQRAKDADEAAVALPVPDPALRGAADEGADQVLPL